MHLGTTITDSRYAVDTIPISLNCEEARPEPHQAWVARKSQAKSNQVRDFDETC